MPLTTCPSPSNLERLCVDGLTEADALGLEQHVQECRACLEKLKAVLPAHDTLIDAVAGRDTLVSAAAAHPLVVELMRKLEKVKLPKPEVRMLRFTCSCGKTLGVKDADAGKKFRCPACGQVAVAPLPVSAGVPMQTPPRVEDLQTSAPVEPVDRPTDPSLSKDDNTQDQSVPAGPEPSLTDFLAPPQAADELGRLGKYRVLAILGHGGMGVVYKAEDPQLKRPVALKAMLPTLGASSTARQRFLREAQAMAAVDHDHVVRVYEVSEDRGIPYLAMEFLKGEPLDARLKHEEKLPLAAVLRIGREIAAGLAAAHATGLIHRDIKPANIWLETKPTAKPRDERSESRGSGARVKILDFGLARAAAEDTHLTQSGAIMGTPAFMAPEQGRAEKVDARCDLFSLGVVLYRLTTGRQPFRGTDVTSTLMSIALDEPAPPMAVNCDVPAELSDLIMKLLAKSPEGRPATAQIVAEALERIARDDGTVADVAIARPALAGASGSADRKPVASARVNWRRRAVLAAVAVAACVLLPLAYFFGGVIIRVATNRGELVVEVDDKNVEVKIVQNGLVVQDRTSKREFTLTAGKGEIEVLEKDGIKLATRQFELTRGGKTTVKVTLQDVADARKPKLGPQPGPPAKGEPGALARGADPDRRAAEYVLSIGGQITVRVKEAERDVGKATEPPKEPFQLTYVNLNRNQQVTDAGLAHFKDCKNLTTLDLFGTGVTDAGLAHFKDYKNLTGLNLGYTRVTDASLAHFKDCKNLTTLHLPNTQVTDAGLAHFKDCKNLRELSLQGLQLTDAGLAHFKDCKNLTTLHVHGPQLTDAGLAHFKDCKNLTTLDLTGMQVTDAGLAHFKDCKNLTRLDLYGTWVTDAGLAHFKDCKNLFGLDLQYTRVTGAGLAHFKDCKNLTVLLLIGTQVTDAGLAHCKNVTHLKLSGTQVTDAGLAHFKDYKNLKELYLSGTQVTDAGLAHFKDCKNLTYLDLNGTRVTDAAVEPLLEIPRLGYLNLGMCRVSRDSVEQLKAAGPQLNIDWYEPNRVAAERVLELGGTVDISLPGQEARPAGAKDPLPRRFFQVRRIAVKDCKQPLGKLPATLALLSLPEFDRLEAVDFTGTPLPEVSFLASVHGLKDAVLARTGLLDQHVGALPKLKRLVLDGNAIGRPGLEALAKQTDLAELSLAGAGLTELALLPRLPQLHKLSLDGNAIRGPGLRSLLDLPKLTELSLACPALTDVGAKHLAGLKGLTRLSLAGAGITDAALQHLEALTNLQNLDLRGTRTSAQGVAALQKALPRCKIEPGPLTEKKGS